MPGMCLIGSEHYLRDLRIIVGFVLQQRLVRGKMKVISESGRDAVEQQQVAGRSHNTIPVGAVCVRSGQAQRACG